MGADEDEDDGGAGVEAEIMQVAPGEHLLEEGAAPGAEAVPTGRVVGIIKRNWRTRGHARPSPTAHPARHCAAPTSSLVCNCAALLLLRCHAPARLGRLR